MNECFIVSGHLNTEDKIKTSLNLLKKIRELRPHITIIFVSHLNIPDDILSLVDTFVFTKENPILNYDISDNFTKKHKNILQTDKFSYLSYSPNASFAHLISICDGLSFGASVGFKKFHYISSDCDIEMLNNLYTHNSYLSSYDACFYEFGEWVNTEFFSFNLKLAKLLFKYRSYENFKKLLDPRLEPAICNLLNSNNIDYFCMKTDKKFGFGNSGFSYKFKYVSGDQKIFLFPIKISLDHYQMVIFTTDENEISTIKISDKKITITDQIAKFDFKIGDVVELIRNSGEMIGGIIDNQNQLAEIIKKGVINGS